MDDRKIWHFHTFSIWHSRRTLGTNIKNTATWCIHPLTSNNLSLHVLCKHRVDGWLRELLDKLCKSGTTHRWHNRRLEHIRNLLKARHFWKFFVYNTRAKIIQNMVRFGWCEFIWLLKIPASVSKWSGGWQHSITLAVFRSLFNLFPACQTLPLPNS